MSGLSFFYHNSEYTNSSTLQLSEETAKHVVQVLRMKEGAQIALNNGLGQSAEATIISAEKKRCTVQINQVHQFSKTTFGLHLCVSFTKNASRNEWLLEKATELGVSSITPIISARSEREKFRIDRWQNILISAMLQSQQYFLPKLNEATKFEHILKNHENTEQKLIAHCDANFERMAIAHLVAPKKNTVILIGPEGDFTPDEINLAMQHKFNGTILCTQRLRTETAAMAVCAHFNLLNNE